MTERDQQLKTARSAAHAAFDPLWQRKVHEAARHRMRDGCYRWLAEQMGLARKKCHIRYFDVGMCEAVIELVAAAKIGLIPGPRLGPSRMRYRDSEKLKPKQTKRKVSR